MAIHRLYPNNTPPAIVERAEEYDRKECIALDQKTKESDRALAQWLLDHPVYTAPQVSKWLDRSESSIKRLRVWARDGFDPRGPHARSNDTNRSSTTDEVLITNDNFQDDTMEPSDDVEDPAEILKNILRSVSAMKAVAEGWRKILKASPFDSEAKTQISTAINQLIVKWRTVQSALDKKGHSNGES